MRTISSCLVVFLITSCAGAKELSFTASTPAALVVRAFLGIPITDSIDFIRWKIHINNNRYSLQCNYGTSKPNTNGFMNGGQKIELNGELKKEKNVYHFYNGNKILRLIEINKNLLHVLNTDNSLLVGNGGWSYTLCNTTPVLTDESVITAMPTIFKDSAVFDGRTPCDVPGIIPAGTLCYKLKWRVIFFADDKSNLQGTYRLLGTPWRDNNGRTGKWEVTKRKDNRTVYVLNDESGKPFIYMLKADENILFFTDVKGNLLVGNEDFSYTLNRIL